MTFRTLNHKGDVTITFDMTVAEEAALATKQFNKELNSGAQLIGIDKEGKSFMAGEFDPNAKEYVVGKRMVGG